MNIQYYAASLLTIMALVSSATETNVSVTGTNVSVTENSVQDTDETYNDLLKQIQAWEESKNWEDLIRIIKSVKQWVNQESQNEGREKKLSMLFLLLNRMDYHYTGIYETPQMNLTPKTTKEPVVSGMSPANIKDPEVRKQYEKDLEENRKIAENALFQGALGRFRENWLDYITRYLMNNYKDEKELIKLIDDNVTKEESRKELKERLDEKIQAQGLAIGRPRKCPDTKLDQRRIQTVQFPLERKFMARRNRLAVLQQHEKKGLEDFRITMLIGIRKIGLARCCFNSKMVEFPSAGLQSTAYFPQTVRLRQLAEDH